MNRPRRTLLAVLFGLSTLILPLAALAATGDQPARQDAYRAGQTLVLTDTVSGDAYLAGRDMTVTGAVAGSVYAVGSTLVVNGAVGGNVYAIAGSVEIHGNVSGHVYALGSDVHLGKDAAVSGNVFLAGTFSD